MCQHIGALQLLFAPYHECSDIGFLCASTYHGTLGSPSSLCNSGDHIESQWLPSPNQIDLLTSEAIWLHNWRNMLAMYSSSAMLRAILDCFLLCHEVMADPRLKQHPGVFFLSETLPAQFESVYSHSLKS
jgi:hypothetical protein